MRGSQPLRLIGVRAGVAALATLAALAAQPAVGAANQVINTPGPLSSIYIDEDLGCQVQASGDTSPSFFGGTEPGACGTFLALTEGVGVAEGTRLFGTSPPADGFPPQADFKPVGPQTLTGKGTEAEPFVVTTHAGAFEKTGEAEGEESDVAELIETDSYVTGRNSYDTTITVVNHGVTRLAGTLYHAGDCFLSGLDTGFGAVNVPTAGSVACTLQPNNSPPARYMAFSPLATSGGASVVSFLESGFSTVWANVNAEATPFPNSVDFTTDQDNGMGLSWPFSLSTNSPPENEATVSFTTTVSPSSAPTPAPSPNPCFASPAPSLTITSDQGHSSYEAGEAASVTIAASGLGLTSDPSAAHVPISTAQSGTFSVTRSAGNACGTTNATFTYTVLPLPVLGRSVNVELVSGRVLIALPYTANASLAGSLADATDSLSKGLRFIPLTEARQIPVGSILNTSAGVARIRTATASKGRLQSGDFGAGIFKLLQRRAQRGLTELDVMDAHSARKTCATLGKRAVAARRLSSKVLGRLRGSAHGRFTTRGQFSAATVRGTVWGVLNRCDGTLTRVTRGTVTVRDFPRRKTITLVTGQSYLAKAPRA